MVKSMPASAGDIRDAGSIPVLGRSPGEGHGNPLQYSCLENPMVRRLLLKCKGENRGVGNEFFFFSFPENKQNKEKSEQIWTFLVLVWVFFFVVVVVSVFWLLVFFFYFNCS